MKLSMSQGSLFKFGNKHEKGSLHMLLLSINRAHLIEITNDFNYRNWFNLFSLYFGPYPTVVFTNKLKGIASPVKLHLPIPYAHKNMPLFVNALLSYSISIASVLCNLHVFFFISMTDSYKHDEAQILTKWIYQFVISSKI